MCQNSNQCNPSIDSSSVNPFVTDYDYKSFSATKECINFETACETCPDGFSCTSCIPGAVHTLATWSCACGPGFIWNSVTDTCDACVSPCAECNDTTTECTVCIAGYTFYAPTDECFLVVCGNGTKEPINEICEDGNTANSDGCSSTCTIETGYECDGGGYNPAAVDTCTPICGDGLRIGTEACDDADTDDGDGCSSTCVVESGFACIGGSAVASDICSTVCGNGLVHGSEVCDDGEVIADGCNASCTGVSAGWDCTGGSTTSISACTTTCGDSKLVISTEVCDDGNTVSWDGCNSNCSADETGWTCTGGNVANASTCTPICGDDREVATEGCDDGNTTSGDGCSSTCTVETGFTCSGGAYTPFPALDVCTEVCGDGKRVGIEVCDDSNTVNNDGCLLDCTGVETGWTCSGGNVLGPDSCGGICGDDRTVAPETLG